MKEQRAEIKDKSYGLEAGVLILIIILLLLAVVPGVEDKVVFLDVRQGDSILLQSKTNQVLIDGGPGMTVLRRLGEEMPWFDRRIEVVVLTHPQRDHMEGLLHALDRYEVGMVLLPKIAHTSQMQEAWLKRITSKGIAYRFAWAGEKIVAGDMMMTILGPFDTEAARAAARANLNNVAVVARVDYGGMSFLLTGDIEKRMERMLVLEYARASSPRVFPARAANVLDVDVLKAGHHGSKTSTNEILIDKAKPAAAVISVGADNKFGHPHPDVLARLGDIPVWRTDEAGSIGFKLMDDGRWIIDVDG